MLSQVNAKNNPRVDLLTTTLGYDIIKQGEKLEYAPSDIKETDLQKFRYVCQDPVFQRNLNRNTDEFQKEVEGVCGVLVSLDT